MIELWETHNDQAKVYFADLEQLVNSMDNTPLKDNRGVEIKMPTAEQNKMWVHRCLTHNLFFFYNGRMVKGCYKK